MQITKQIFLKQLEIMKKVLNLAEFKLGKGEDFDFFREQIMDYFYNNLYKLFKTLETNKIVERCDCKSSMRKGYQDCEKCAGSGYKNREKKC